MEVKENQELTKQQHMNLFRAIIKAYGVAASYGYQRKMAIDHPLCDFFGVFGEKEKVYKQEDINPFWNDVVMGNWKCPLDNPFVQFVMKCFDWDKI